VAQQKNLIKRGIALEYITLIWNVVGFGVILYAAFKAHSVALAGFGLDSFIEIFASVIVVWQLKSINKDKEWFAERLIGYTFFALALYLVVQIIIVIANQTHPQQSTLGIVWLALTAAVMFLLAYGKMKVGNAIQNPVLQKEAKVTLIDAMLAVSVLVGLGVNAIFGIWYADVIAALVIVYYGVKEGVHALKG